MGVASEVVLEGVKAVESLSPQQLHRAVSLYASCRLVAMLTFPRAIETILKECAGVKSEGFLDDLQGSETQEGIVQLGIEVEEAFAQGYVRCEVDLGLTNNG